MRMHGIASPFPAVWTGRRLGWTIVVILALQVGLIAWFSEPEPPPWRYRPVSAYAYLILDEATQAKLAQDLATLDPTLFALPHALNFSGSAWLNLPKTNQDLADWPDTSPLPALDPALISAAGAPARTFQVAYPAIADKPEPRWFETAVPPEPLAAGTEARLEGDLRLRPVRFMPEFQVWPYHDLISNTVVQLWVDAEGLVREAGLWTECGIPEADRYALREAKRIRLEPLPRSGMAPDPVGRTAGSLVVRWGTAPVSGTNPPRSSP